MLGVKLLYYQNLGVVACSLPVSNFYSIDSVWSHQYNSNNTKNWMFGSSVAKGHNSYGNLHK